MAVVLRVVVVRVESVDSRVEMAWLVLRGHGHAAADAVVDIDGSAAAVRERASSTGLPVVPLAEWKRLVRGRTLHLRVTRHLRAAGFDAVDLAEMGALLDEAVELLADTLDKLELVEVAGQRAVPAVDQLVLRRVAELAVASLLARFSGGVRRAELGARVRRTKEIF